MKTLSWPLALWLLAVPACASSTPPAGAPASDPTARATSAAPGAPPPAPPPQPLKPAEAFYIMALPAPTSTTAASVTVCVDDLSCTRSLGGAHAEAVHRFGDENWVIITTPAGQRAASVSSDGSSATVEIERACDASMPAATTAQFTLYRVSKSVTQATLRDTALRAPCPRTP